MWKEGWGANLTSIFTKDLYHCLGKYLSMCPLHMHQTLISLGGIQDIEKDRETWRFLAETLSGNSNIKKQL